MKLKALALFATFFVAVLPLSAKDTAFIRAAQLDLARQKEPVSFVQNFIERCADVGYNTVFLYLEDRVKTVSYPYPTDAESYLPDDIRAIVETAKRKSIDLVPVVSPLGHTERFLRHPELKRFAEARSGIGRFGPREDFDVFCLSDPEACAWMERYITEVAALFPGRNLHLGFDETFDLGFCDRCRPVMEKEGLGRLFLRHVLWAHDLARRLGKRMWMWDDFFAFFPECLPDVPRDVMMCLWNYDENIERTGPRNNFGGRRRRDSLAEYERLGIDAIVCSYHRLGNIRSIFDYASSRRHAGFLITQWELETQFYGWYFPRVLAAAELLRDPTSVVNDEWFARGVRQAFCPRDERTAQALTALMSDTGLRPKRPSVPEVFNGRTDRAKITAWKAVLAVLKDAPSQPGASAEIPADGLSPEGLLEDLVIRTEFAVLSHEACALAQRLVYPDRTVAETRATKAVLEAMQEQWDAVCARRERQWRVWRKGVDLSATAKSLHASYGPFLEKVRAIQDVAADDEWLFEADILMGDAYGIPYWRVEGLFDGCWREIASGVWKSRVGQQAYTPVLVPVTLSVRPSRLRISHKGYGSGEMCHVSLWNARTRLVPKSVVGVTGNVRNAVGLVTDDFRVASFGETDCTRVVLEPKLAETISAVELELSALGTGLTYDIHTRALTPVRELARPEGGTMMFVKDGTLDFVLVVDRAAETRAKNATRKSIAPALEILQESFEKTTGMKPVIVDENDTAELAKHRYWLLVGDSRLAREQAKLDWSKLPEQGYAVKTFPRGIAIIGFDSSLVEGWNVDPIERRGASTGTLYGALDFAERFLGIRHYLPGEYGSLWPMCRDLMIEPVHYEDAPYFNIRVHPWYYYCSVATDALVEKWSRYLGKGIKKGDTSFLRYWRQGATLPFMGSHCPEAVEYAKIHPDRLKDIFYTSPSGKFWHNPRAGIGNYYDVTNLKFADLLMEDYRKYYETGGKVLQKGMRPWCCRAGVSFGVCDTYLPPDDFLGNPVVKELGLIRKDDLKGPPRAVPRNVFGRFFQYLGNSLKRDLPGKELWLLAYYNAQYAPNDPRWKLPDNIQVNLCLGGMPRKAVDPATAEDHVKIAREWYDALGGRPVQQLWTYAARSDPFQRAVSQEFIGNIPAIFGKYLGRRGIFYDYDGARDMWHFYYAGYVGEKSQWNPAFDVDAALDEHWVPFFGAKAGPHMKEFHRLLKNLFVRYAKTSDEEAPLYPTEVIDALEAELKAACAAVDDDSVEWKRVHLVADYWPAAFTSQRTRAAYKKPVYDLKRVDATTDWSKLPDLPLIDIEGRGGTALPVSVKLGWDDAGIHGRLDSNLPPMASPAKDEFNNDSIEFFLMPGLKQEVVYQLVWDAVGHLYSRRQRLLPIPQPSDNTWKAEGHRFVPQVRADGWTAEFFVPFSALSGGKPQEGESWYANLVFTNRKDVRVVRGSCLTMGTHGNREMYGFFRFIK